MQLLVIGGTYFLGRVFVMQACQKHQLTLVNRGRYEINHPQVKAMHFDRHDMIAWQKMPPEHYDAIIDFCAYDPGDIACVLQNYRGIVDHYVLISTCDVYARHSQVLKNEQFPLETQTYDGEIGAYISGKITLEKELEEQCQLYHLNPMILRPGNIIGPYNYAPREALYIQMMIQQQPLYLPDPLSGQFQLVYVKDVANAILQLLERPLPKACYNIISPEILNYETFYQALANASLQPVQIIKKSITELWAAQYPLCYPVLEAESELYDGSKICCDYPFSYTPIALALEKTYQAFYPVFSHDSC